MKHDRRSDLSLFAAPAPTGPSRDQVIDRMQDALDNWLDQSAHQAATCDDVAAVARDTALFRTHRPLIVEVLTETDATHREVGFYSEDGRYIGLRDPVVACHAHEDLIEWPCPVLRARVAMILTDPGQLG